MHILIFGDSITYGAWDGEGGWANRLRNFFDRMQMEKRLDYCLTYNLGISGDTTRDVLKRFESETKRRFEDEKEFTIIFSIGSNDSEIINKTNATLVSEKEFTKNVDTLIKKAKKLSKNVVFTGLLNVDETRTVPIPWMTTRSYKNDTIKKYDSIISSECKRNKIHFIEMFGKIREEFLFDGVHPNSMGHEKIFSAMKEYLIKNNIIVMK